MEKLENGVGTDRFIQLSPFMNNVNASWRWKRDRIIYLSQMYWKMT